MEEQRIISKQIVQRGIEKEAEIIEKIIAGLPDPEGSFDECRNKISSMLKEMTGKKGSWGQTQNESEA